MCSHASEFCRKDSGKRLNESQNSQWPKSLEVAVDVMQGSLALLPPDWDAPNRPAGELSAAVLQRQPDLIRILTPNDGLGAV